MGIKSDYFLRRGLLFVLLDWLRIFDVHNLKKEMDCFSAEKIE